MTRHHLFLAIITVVGITVMIGDHEPAGWALVISACGSMLAAAIVLVPTGSSYSRAAVMGDTFPLLAVVTAVIAAS